MNPATKRSLLTPSQTVGPFFHGCLLRADAARQVLVEPNAEGELIRLEGVVYDGDRSPVPDAMIEIWQADHRGHYHDGLDDRSQPNERNIVGYGRCGTDTDGRYAFDTVKPGQVAFDATRKQAPHISMAIFARGLLNHLFTRVYFDGDTANHDDPVIARVPPARRATLMAHRKTQGERVVYDFDVVLQGNGETVFFDFGATTPSTDLGQVAMGSVSRGAPGAGRLT